MLGRDIHSRHRGIRAATATVSIQPADGSSLRAGASCLIAHLLLAILSLAVCCGCHSRREFHFTEDAQYEPFSMQIEYPDECVQQASYTEDEQTPFSLREGDPKEFWPLSLEETVRMALANSEVMRDLGARVVTTPASASTVYDPALQLTDPRAGEESALSEFDAQFATSIFWDRSERLFNNGFAGAGALSLHRNTSNFQMEIFKRAMTGTQMAVRNLTFYDRNNSRANLFPSAYDTIFEAELRHPLLQGSGIEFNRIAGPTAGPSVTRRSILGNYNGIALARIRTDVSLADFEASVRNFLRDVERTYWQLYFLYRVLDARIAARDAALETWRTAKAQLDAGAGDSLAESLAREQYYQFQSEVENALSGVLTNLAIGGGTGVYATERNLRLLMGIPLSDGRLIRPTDEPSRAETIFEWADSLQESTFRRVELRRQKWTIRQRELELIAARSFVRMRLDFVSKYQWRGFGDNLLSQSNSAFDSLLGGDLQGWQLGLELATPIGNRIGHVAVRNAELALSRERAVLREQERSISKELMDGFSELDRAYVLTRTSFDRAVAARQRLQAAQDKYEFGEGLLEFVFDAQSRVAEADSEFFRSLVDYNLAIAQVHYAKGTYLDYLGVELTEGPWSGRGHQSALKEARRWRQRNLNHCITMPRPVSRGPYEQHVLPRGEELELLPTPSEEPNAAPVDAELESALPPDELPEQE